jgi:hypothetical protein
MGDDEEAVKHAEGKRRHREEVHCCNGLTMIAQKGSQRLAGSGLLGAFRIQRCTVRSERSNPSILSSP